MVYVGLRFVFWEHARTKDKAPTAFNQTQLPSLEDLKHWETN